ncbi:YceI family protein [Vibrio sp. OCN044]|uniref:YceI family protein n=1 Tax=Vibrio tetraodonis subsp. pristinus TaxID=2695891 RepID=A0A6L8LZU5_9VIBR|nr:YceI family protein [Vibrio tetraodonis]MYM60230.1 YceI family protein [Vibrio tetraodonis subsp. pristinus]
MKKTLSSLSIVCALFSSTLLANNDYDLDSELSSVGFATIKKQFVVEPATIDTLSGTLAASGKFEISVDLKGIDTGISIRDTRLNDVFFESAKFPNVTASGNVNWSGLGQGSHKMLIPAEVTLFGNTKTINFPTVVLKTDEIVMVSSSAPVIISASDFGIPSDNLNKLAALVGGIKISDKVPLTLNLTFKK